MTNGDILRQKLSQMTDEELMEHFSDFIVYDYIPLSTYDKLEKPGECAKDFAKRWLSMEVSPND